MNITDVQMQFSLMNCSRRFNLNGAESPTEKKFPSVRDAMSEQLFTSTSCPELPKVIYFLSKILYYLAK